MVAQNTPNKLISDESYALLAIESESEANDLPHTDTHTDVFNTNARIGLIHQNGNNDNNVIDCLDIHKLHDYVRFGCDIEHNQYVWLGSERKFGLGFVREWCQRRSIRSNLQLVCNGLKPVKGSQNKFMINEISDNLWSTSMTTGSGSALECVDTEVNYSNRVVNGFGGEYPISETAKVIATSKRSKLFIVSLPYNQNEDIIGIRANDGFVLIHSKLSIFSLTNYDKNGGIKRNNDSELNKRCFSNLENGHLFILGEGGHLLLIDKRNSVQSSRQCILLVGKSGFDSFSLNDRKNNCGARDSSGEHSSHKLCADSPITASNSFVNSKRSFITNDSTRTSGRQVHLHNGDNYNTNSIKNCVNNEQKMTEIKTKRCTDVNMIDDHIKKQKCDYSSIDC